MLAVTALAAVRVSAVPAFPGAEGFGANASGGRGGTVYRVTNLNDSGPGSFRDAVSVSGRTVIFDVGGIINITSPVVVKPDITIAGQTAPGQGVTIYGNRISYSGANNTITRYLRIREGINGPSGSDAVGAANGENMIFDHVSVSWGRDETFSLSGTLSNITLQDCIIGQGLMLHSAGGLMQTTGGVSILRTLYIDNWMRNPKIKGINDYQNNVVYNYGSGGGYIPAGDSAGLSYANMINCYFIAGPSTPAGESPFKTGNQNYSLYHSGNLQDLNVNGLLDGVAVTDASFPTLNIVATPFDYPKPATLLTAEQAYAHVVAHAGASLFRDHADTYMINELTSNGTLGALIFNEGEIGGIGTLEGGVAPADTDLDGMPDWWEQAAGHNASIADNNDDLDGDGYTNLEEYLNALAPAGVQVARITGITPDSGSSAADGVTSAGQLVVHGMATPGATVSISRVDLGVIGTTTANGAGEWQFDYSGTPLADRYYGFQAAVELAPGQLSPLTRVFVVKVDTVGASAPAITSIVSSPSIVINGTSEPGSTVTVQLVGGGVVGSAVADGLGNWSAPYSGPALAPGVNEFTASAVDLAGNAGAISAPYAVDTSLAAPVFTSITTDTGVSSSDEITNDPSLILNGTAFANAIVSIAREGVGVIGSATANGSGVWSFNYTGTSLSEGSHVFTATGSNGSTTSPASTPYVVTVDRTRPTIPQLRRYNPDTPATTASTLVFRLVWSEPVTGVDVGDFVLTKSGTADGTLADVTPVSDSVYDITVSGVSGDGTIRVDRRSSGTGIADLAGNAVSGGFTGGQVYTIRLAGSGVWIATESGLAWSDAANWENGVVVSGVGATADFAQVDVNGENVVVLDSPRTVGRVAFGDTDWTLPAEWRLTDGGNPANVLTLDGPNPGIHVDADTTTGDTVDVPAAAATPSILDVVLAGSGGFTKTGVGTIEIVKPATITGPLTISKGIVQVGPGGVLAPESVAISTSQQLRVAGGTFSTAGDVTWASGTGTGIIVSAGSASFTRILPSNARNSFVRVTGGNFTATEISFLRSGDSQSQALAAGVQIEGGESTVGTIGLGTGNSWGAMTISGGKLTVTGPVHVGFQATSGRGGDVVVSGGEFNVTDATANGGLILTRNPVTDTPARASQPNQVGNLRITGGVSNVSRIALGYDATSSAGSATVTVTDGELNLGAGGIVKGGASGLTSSVTLNSGVLGAIAPWSTTHPVVVSGAADVLAIRAGDADGNAFDITLGGGLVGTGGFAKTGAGALVLSAANTYAGATSVNAGTLLVTGSLDASTEAVTVNTGGTLAGTGSVGRPVVLAGGSVAPGAIGAVGTLSGTSLVWSSGALAVDVAATGVADQLVLSGALTKTDAGSSVVAFTPGAGFAAGNTYTLATFASTDFTAGDFAATGLPAGTGALFTVSSSALQVTIQGTPTITSALTADGLYGASFTYTATSTELPVTFTAAGLPPGLAIDSVTGVISGVPTAAGLFPVTLSATNTAGTGSATLVLNIAKATAAVGLGSGGDGTIRRSYDGTAQSATVTTVPAGLNATYTYNGSSEVPTLPGTYDVVATIDDPNYTGTATGKLVITITALVRQVPQINGDLDGSIQVLTGANFALNGSTLVSGDLLVPGTPEVRLNGHPTLAGVKEANGAATPNGYTITLNGAAMARYLVTRVDPIALPTVTAPLAPTGTRSVHLSSATDNPGDFGTIRNLTVQGSAGDVVVPAGKYGQFVVNGSGALVLGEVGATTPSVYHVQNLILNGGSLKLRGPVLLVLANGVNVNGGATTVVGDPANAEWLQLEVANGGVTLNGRAQLNAIVAAPNGRVMINGGAILRGRISADALSINGDGLLQEAP